MGAGYRRARLSALAGGGAFQRGVGFEAIPVSMRISASAAVASSNFERREHRNEPRSVRKICRLR
jgi:hypothetical protein